MSLLHDVAVRLDELDIPLDVRGLALAACSSDDALSSAVAGHPVELPPADRDQPHADAAVRLAAITVAGFRGIGQEVTLDLAPVNGLTLVVGNNGSGKSSFAEAVEFVLTGDNTRWSKRSKVWRDGWRNLHHPDPAFVRAGFVSAKASDPVAITRTWEAGAKLEDHTIEASDGEDLEARGWSAGLELYRPFLPYGELGALVDDGPTALHDTLSAVLGLDVLTAGAKRLRADRLDRQRAIKDSTAAAASLADEIAAIDDPRAADVATLLRAPHPDPEAVASHADDSRPDLDPAMDVLRVLVGLPGPDLDAVRHAADALDNAVDMVRSAEASDPAHELETAELLAAAQRWHVLHGDGDCPVCGGAPLDATWSARAHAVEAELRDRAGAVEGATGVLTAARRVLAAVASDPPVSLHRAGMADVDASLVLQTWEALAAARTVEDDRERAVQIRKGAEAVSNALVDLRARAKAALAERTDDWAPTARRLDAWVQQARLAREDDRLTLSLKAAEDAVNLVLDKIRAERWTPIAEQARAIWQDLGQASSVQIEDVALTGTGTRRRVEVSVTVDGIDGAALGVMSQGELHALALSLFLPRACLPESPFGFIVIDDPVQSMDALRVDGLATVLSKTAQTRQVVVFTHDERLVEAVLQQRIPTTLIEVHRAADSDVRPQPRPA